MRTIKKTYLHPTTESFLVKGVNIFSASINSDGEVISEDPTPGDGGDQAARFNFFVEEEENEGSRLWSE